MLNLEPEIYPPSKYGKNYSISCIFKNDVTGTCSAFVQIKTTDRLYCADGENGKKIDYPERCPAKKGVIVKING